MDFYFLLKGGSGSHVIDEVSFRVYKKKRHKFKQNQQRENIRTLRDLLGRFFLPGFGVS